jgi:hypothetical protein
MIQLFCIIYFYEPIPCIYPNYGGIVMLRLPTIILALLAFCINLPTSTAMGQEKTILVIADGYSYMGDSDTIKTARERALAEAVRNAVEQGSSSYIESTTTVKNHEVASDEIRSRVKGVITSKKILMDELERDTLRYHIRLKANVKFADLKTPLEQPAESTSSSQGLSTRIQNAFVQSTAALPRPTKKDQNIALSRLRRVKDKNPQRYIQLMNRVEPKLRNTNIFIARLNRVEGKHPEAACKVRTMLRKTPVRGQGKDSLSNASAFLKPNIPGTTF